MSRLIGVDVGGTFTDIVVLEDGQVQGRKVPTSAHQADAVAAAVSGAASDIFLHGTTVATNTLLEERGARVALVTDVGYEDLIEIGRQDRPALYDSFADRPRPLVDRDARIGYRGDVDGLRSAIRELAPEAVAVSLIEAYRDDAAERAIVEAIRAEVDVPVLRSSLVSPEFREYERTATTVLAAYLSPSVTGYLGSLDARLPMSRRLVMTSAGGLLPFSAAQDSAARLVLSGPAGGAVAAAALAHHHGYATVLSFDMGGTSTDVCRIEGSHPAVGAGHRVAGRVDRVPSIPIRTIGAGGGSIGWRDSGGALRVGPTSAGAVPGPAAYGRGGAQPTITDAEIVAGHLPPNLALGGTVGLQADLARAAIERLAASLGLETTATAAGMLEVVDSHMEHALRAVSVEEGSDPADAVLVAFGGAGGLHASRLARRLGMSRVLIPPLSGVFSALGLLLATPRQDAARTLMLREAEADLRSARSSVEAAASAVYEDTFGQRPSGMSTTADVRYVGQSHELEVPLAAGWIELRRAFEADHRQQFGFDREGQPIELVTVRAVATGEPPTTWARLPRLAGGRGPVGQAGVWQRPSLPPGFRLSGPAMVVEADSAIRLQPGDRLTVLEDGTLELAL
jgi:N-methylhydantoinase A